MSRQARVAWTLAGLAVVLGVVHTWLFWGWSAARQDTSGWPVLTVGVVLSTALGALIVTRRPGHRVGWLFVIGGVCGALGNALFAYDAIATAGANPDPPAIWHVAVWTALFLDVPEPVLFVTLLFLLFPDGHLPSRRWRPVLWAALTGFTLFVLLLAVVIPPGQIEPDYRTAGWGNGTTQVIAAVLLLCLVVTLLAAAASVVVRLRRSVGVERQQLRLLAWSAALVAVGFALAATLPWDTGFANWLRVLPLHLGFVGVVVGAALAVLRYRLYDLNVVVSRALVLAMTTALVAVGYVLVVVVISGLVGPVLDTTFWASLLATVVVALAIQPLRVRVLRLADRLAFGRRAAPYEALAELSRGLAAAPGAPDLLGQVAAAVAEASGARQVTATLDLPGQPGGVVAQWPKAGPATEGAPPIELPVVDRGERLGRVLLAMPPGRPLREDERVLVEQLLDQTALALRNLRLERELAGRVRELDQRTAALEQSRRELLEASDSEKARFSTRLSRVVLPHLAPLPGLLADLGRRLSQAGTADEVVRSLAAAQEEASQSLEELRRLVRGLKVRVAPDGQRPVAAQATASRSGPNADFVR